MADEPESRTYKLALVEWQGQPHCIYLNDYRIAGGKPWAGGILLREWSVTLDDLRRAVSNRVILNPLVAENKALCTERDALAAENERLRATMRHWEGEIGGATCDWGYCDRPTEDYRISPDTLTVLPVCAAHTAGAEAQRPVWDAIWRMTNLPFSDDDRRKIQQIALAFKEGGPRPGSWVAQYIAALTTAPAPEGGE